MARFTVIRRKVFHAKVEANDLGKAFLAANNLAGRSWQAVEDRVVTAIALDGTERVAPSEMSHDPHCAACVAQRVFNGR